MRFCARSTLIAQPRAKYSRLVKAGLITSIMFLPKNTRRIYPMVIYRLLIYGEHENLRSGSRAATAYSFYILFALAEGEKHGYAIMKEVENVSGGQFTMGPGTLYTTIQRLLELGLIEETSTSSSPERRRRSAVT